jgi:hypothetical protein
MKMRKTIPYIENPHSPPHLALNYPMPEAVLLLLLLTVTPPGQGTEDQHHLAAQNLLNSGQKTVR